jgi:hypothetical protein
MALPKIATPTFDITLPLSQTKIQFRPFLVKEQKILLMAMESGEKDVIESNIKHILSDCLLTEIDIDSLPLVDMEYYFLNLRARSVGEIIQSKYKCENIVDEKICGNSLETSFNILDIKLEVNEEVDSVIELGNGVGIKMKYPSFEVVDRIKGLDSVTDAAFELIVECVDYIFENDNFYYAHETPKPELMTFIESLTKEQFDRVEKFVENLPSLKKELDITCPKCGFNHNITIEGLESFF